MVRDLTCLWAGGRTTVQLEAGTVSCAVASEVAATPQREEEDVPVIIKLGLHFLGRALYSFYNKNQDGLKGLQKFKITNAFIFLSKYSQNNMKKIPRGQHQRALLLF